MEPVAVLKSFQPPKGKQRWELNVFELYKAVEQVGQGTYGEVWKANCLETGRVVAMKKVLMNNEKEGFPITALREIKILKLMDHENIVQLLRVVRSKGTDFNRSRGTVYMIFEYLEHDLTGLLDTKGVRLTPDHIKSYTKQLLDAVNFMHNKGILHRDIKGANLLLSRGNVLKLADWGLARKHSNRDRKPNKMSKYTHRVCTLWYRAPELLLGETRYGPEIDMWSVGCIFAEWCYRKPILPGADEHDQLKLIFNLCGTPDPVRWPNHELLPLWHIFQGIVKKSPRPNALSKRFASFNSEALNLVTQLMHLDPRKRITAVESLNHDYFWTKPLPKKPEQLPVFDVESAHEFQAKKRREKERQKFLERQKQRQQKGRSANQAGHSITAPSRRRSHTHSVPVSTSSSVSVTAPMPPPHTRAPPLAMASQTNNGHFPSK